MAKHDSRLNKKASELLTCGRLSPPSNFGGNFPEARARTAAAPGRPADCKRRCIIQKPAQDTRCRDVGTRRVPTAGSSRHQLQPGGSAEIASRASRRSADDSRTSGAARHSHVLRRFGHQPMGLLLAPLLGSPLWATTGFKEGF